MDQLLLVSLSMLHLRGQMLKATWMHPLVLAFFLYTFPICYTAGYACAVNERAFHFISYCRIIDHFNSLRQKKQFLEFIS